MAAVSPKRVGVGACVERIAMTVGYRARDPDVRERSHADNRRCDLLDWQDVIDRTRRNHSIWRSFFSVAIRPFA
jgi:hypothetical protein